MRQPVLWMWLVALRLVAPAAAAERHVTGAPVRAGAVAVDALGIPQRQLYALLQRQCFGLHAVVAERQRDARPRLHGAAAVLRGAQLEAADKRLQADRAIGGGL